MSTQKDKPRSGLSLHIDRRIERMTGKAAIHPDNISKAGAAAPTNASDGRSGLAKRIDARIAASKRG